MAKGASHASKDGANAVRAVAASRARAAAPSRQASGVAERIAGWQRAGGNQAVAQVLGPGGNAAGIPVGHPDDIREREARRAADGVLRAPLRSIAGGPATAGSSRGEPLDKATREFFEPRFAMDLSGVRIHTGDAAAEAAQSLGANAFTVKSDIVFDAGQYAPGSPQGRRLLAHELAHVAQQTGAANHAGIHGRASSPVIQRDTKKDYKQPDLKPGDFGPKYSFRHKGADMPYFEQYKESVRHGDREKAQAASKYGGTKIDPEKMEISAEELQAILNPPGTNHDAKLDDTIESYRSSINLAFKALELDTVEAQAVYLAHSAGETGSLKQLEERYSVRKKGYQAEGFPGRGPVQVTGQVNYVQTLVFLEAYLENLMASDEPGAAYQATVVKTAINAIREDPHQAANPAFTFLFSAAFMHMAGGARQSAKLGSKESFPGNSFADQWVNSRRNNARELKSATTDKAALDAKAAGGGKDAPALETVTDAGGRVKEASSIVDRSKLKAETYERAYEILSKKKMKNETKGAPNL
jgi:Domain of unknown function (DUF4157)